MGKPFFKSKTFWFNVLAIAVLVANSFGFEAFKLDNDVATLVVAAVNILLRFVTREPVTFGGR